jgi:thiamine-phosphate pyrophosphorylase
MLLIPRSLLRGGLSVVITKFTCNKSVYRLIDVNLNRAREGIRVIEDTARLVWNDKKLFSSLRSLRHMLDMRTRAIYGEIVSARDARADNGRNASSGSFAALDHLVRANFRRAQESVRVLEEYSRLIKGSRADTFKRIRFRLYRLEKQVYADFTAGKS